MTVLLDTPAAAAELVGVFEPGSPAWHAARANGIGGSGIAAVLGLSKWDSPFSLWHRKAGIVSRDDSNTEMTAGRYLEPVVCQVFADRHPEFLVKATGTWRNLTRPEQIANPDRLLYPAHWPCDCDVTGDELHYCLPGQPTAILEAKFTLYPDEWGDEGTDDVPPYYKAQCRWYCDVLGVTRCHLMTFVGSTGQFREYVIDADPQDAAFMRERAAAFMQSIRDRVRPSIDGHNETYWVVKQIPEGMDDVDVEVSFALRDRYFDALEAAEAAETEKRAAAALVLDAIGTGRRAVIGPDRVATRTVRCGRTYSLIPARNRGTK